jgi:hypothetical protein
MKKNIIKKQITFLAFLFGFITNIAAAPFTTELVTQQETMENTINRATTTDVKYDAIKTMVTWLKNLPITSSYVAASTSSPFWAWKRRVFDPIKNAINDVYSSSSNTRPSNTNLLNEIEALVDQFGESHYGYNAAQEFLTEVRRLIDPRFVDTTRRVSVEEQLEALSEQIRKETADLLTPSATKVRETRERLASLELLKTQLNQLVILRERLAS